MTVTLEPLFLGIDGGGTHCRVRLTDHSGAIIGNGLAGSANVYSNPYGTLESIMQAVDQALEQAGLDCQAMPRIYAGIGLAGGAMPAAVDFLQQWQHPFAKARFVSDSHIACLGAHAGADGSILIIGTGISGWSIVEGRTRSWSGWGFPFADTGSGAWLGLRLYQLTIDALDGIIPHTEMTLAMAADYQHRAENMVQAFQQASPAQMAELAVRVVEHAALEDRHALTIVAEQQKIIRSLLTSMHTFNHQPIALLGGLSEFVSSHLTEEFKQLLTGTAGDPLSGALLLASEGVTI
ncbi:BadF/BadG/BcrA/BcrD ATPase family protein [Gynuella sunshinyii]|uniref:Putative N-acetylglucosamine kinase n=1 Tax=Gynuella sunshinyii YC6258 TaxID=1445510 RepID=A0A0C5VDF0_9GAMM|nr:BadF/BadG/BcrA/BcrD ATPase family protein [Gynuella sunshinyii]AJQ92572.1 putative N-acetylglucosamine kinase [Gynuella sunshinyii YC6258]